VGAGRETGCGGNDPHGGHECVREYGSVSGVEGQLLDGISRINTPYSQSQSYFIPPRL
jgi:hypothetical protein